MVHKRTKKPQPRTPLVGYCTECGKVRYLTRADARDHAKRIAKRMRAYKCPVDGVFWHLTSWQPETKVTYYRDRETREAPETGS